jgi:hypothetical protein
VSSSTGSWSQGGNDRIPTSPLSRHVFVALSLFYGL